MKIRLAASPQKESIVDGIGIRIVIWNQGCKLKCPGCHNPETHDMKGGREIDISEIENFIFENASHHQGITLSGGDPFLQPKQNKALADYAHTLGLNVWVYCGKTYEQLKEDELSLQLLKSCDVLVDGPFIYELRDITLPFRGSSNQRIIDIQKSLKQNKTILWEC